MDLICLPHPNNFLIVEPLDYPNPYDYKTPHRHDYFEIILATRGGGEQLIDFTRSTLEANSIYLIYPRQVHLLKRNLAEGLVLQFRKDIFEFIFPLQHHFLYFGRPDISLDANTFRHLYQLTQHIQQLVSSNALSPLSIHKSYSYLQILLITLIELHQQQAHPAAGNLPGQFLQLLALHIKEKKKVSEYARLMNLSTDRLTTLCKETLGVTPLKLIHEELLLEIKRSLLLRKLSLKEIAYELNFENTANFSNFVKSATGQTPSELQEQMKQLLLQTGNL